MTGMKKLVKLSLLWLILCPLFAWAHWESRDPVPVYRCGPGSGMCYGIRYDTCGVWLLHGVAPDTWHRLDYHRIGLNNWINEWPTLGLPVGWGGGLAHVPNPFEPETCVNFPC